MEVSEAFARWDMLGMYEEQFHLDDDPLPHIPARSVAGIRTHDMEPIAELVATTDTSAYRARLGAAHSTVVEPRWNDVVEQMLIRLAASDAYLVIADLDDLAFTRLREAVADGATVVEIPPGMYGTANDAAFKYLTDFGATGPDRGEGGKYLFVPPGYDGDVPDEYFVLRSNGYRM